MYNRFAIIVSQYNDMITNALLQGALSRLIAGGIDRQDITIITVPGAVEIPLTAQLIAKSNQFTAIICLGAVIRGDTDHYDYVCDQVSQGCQRVMLDHEIPVIFGVLTTNNLEQAQERIGGKHGHKGTEAAEAALHMADVVAKLRDL